MKYLAYLLILIFFSCKTANNFYQGRVTNEENQPLEGVIVAEDHHDKQTKTDKTGYFKLDRSPDWLGNLIFIKQGYRQDTIPTVWHQAGETTRYNFIENDTTIVKLQHIPTKEKSTPLSRLDSIDKANSETVIAAGELVTRAFVRLKDGDSIIHLSSNIRQDHRIFGYAEPDNKSERLFLLSVFTNDVKDNPFGLKLGAYYETAGMKDLILKYISTNENFVKATATDNQNHSTTLYFEKQWIELE